MSAPNEWKPLAIRDVQQQLGVFTEWTLCGGYSLDLILGGATRPHGDVDIGVFRSRLIPCLRCIGRDRVFLCSPPGTQTRWNGDDVDPAVHDIWISDSLGKFWVLQIMVFDDEADTVFYRRDRRICWPKRSHSLPIGDVQVLNPLITLLYKANKTDLEEKEIMDISALIAAAPKLTLR